MSASQPVSGDRFESVVPTTCGLILEVVSRPNEREAIVVRPNGARQVFSVATLQSPLYFRRLESR